jgi:hypothetical protein
MEKVTVPLQIGVVAARLVKPVMQSTVRQHRQVDQDEGPVVLNDRLRLCFGLRGRMGTPPPPKSTSSEPRGNHATGGSTSLAEHCT